LARLYAELPAAILRKRRIKGTDELAIRVPGTYAAAVAVSSRAKTCPNTLRIAGAP
jgi:hypothetical protein